MNTVTFKSATCVGTLQSHLAAAPVISMQKLLSQSNNQGLKKHSSGQKLEFSKYLKAIISYICVSFIVFKVLKYSMNSQQPTSLCYI